MRTYPPGELADALPQFFAYEHGAARRPRPFRQRRRELLEHARARSRAHVGAVRRLPDASCGQARLGQRRRAAHGAGPLRRRRDGRRDGRLRRRCSRRRDELHLEPRFRRAEVQRRHRHERVRPRRQELEHVGRGWHARRRAAQHHRLVRSAARRPNRPQPRAARPELVPALGPGSEPRASEAHTAGPAPSRPASSISTTRANRGTNSTRACSAPASSGR